MAIDEAEARRALARELELWRARPYEELVARIGGEPFTKEVSGPSGAAYQIEIEVVWDREPRGDVRVLGMVDDGGWRAFAPLSDGFLLSSDGTFVGE